MPEGTDATFYRSPTAAIAAPPEELAYVAAFDPAGEQRDAMTVVDCDPESSSYGQVVGWTDLPRRQRAASLRLERLLQRALPRGPRWRARAPLPDCAGPAILSHPRARHRARPTAAAGRAHDRARGARRESGLFASAHRALRPGRHLHVQPGRRRRRRGPGRRGADRPRDLRGHRRLGDRPWRAVLRLRPLVALERGRGHHLGVGDPGDDRGRPEPRGPPRKAVRPSPRLLEPLGGKD